MHEEENNNDNTKKHNLVSRYGVIASILIGCWIIGMSIILSGAYIVRHLGNGNLVAGTQNTTAEQPAPEKFDIKLTDTDPVLGSGDAPVTIIEYADFQCPFCKQFQDTIMPWIKTTYIDSGKVKFVFRNFAFLGPESNLAAEGSKCAQDQNKFWEYHDKLYATQAQENSGAVTVAALNKFAAGLKLDTKAFNSCLTANKYKAEVEKETQEAGGYKVEATPTIFINGQKFEGVQPQSVYKAAIESALKN